MFSILLVVICVIACSIMVVSDEAQEYCDRKWPELDLLLPVKLSSTNTRIYEWNDDCINTMVIFWPTKRSNTSVVIILDAEEKGSETEDQVITQVIKKRVNDTNFPQIEVKYHNKTMEYRWGHDRQQHLMFYPELYTSKEFVGYVDTDTFFTASIDREDIFENGKPIVHGRIGVFRNAYFPMYAKSTYTLLGLEEPMVCMSYFPVVFKTAHLKELRDHVAAHTGMSFDEAFIKYAMTGTNRYSQFNLMCTYVFWKRKDDYSWAIHDTDPQWSGKDNPKPASGQWADRSVFPNGSFVLKPFISIHARYHYLAGPFNIQSILARSMCHTRPNNNPAGLNCTEYLTHFKYHDHMYKFEDADYTPLIDNNILIGAQLERQKRFEHCDISYGKEQFWKSFSSKTIHDVQKLLFG